MKSVKAMMTFALEGKNTKGQKVTVSVGKDTKLSVDIHPGKGTVDMYLPGKVLEITTDDYVDLMVDGKIQAY